MKTNKTLSRLSGVTGLLIGAAGLVFVVYRLIDGWSQVSHTLQQGRPLVAATAIAVGLAGMTIIGTNWWVLLRRLGSSIGLAGALFRYFVGQLGKYIPGGVWPIVGRAEMARRSGVVDSPTAYASTLLSLALTYLAALVTAAAALALAGPARYDWPWAPWVLLAIPVGLIALHPRALGGAIGLVGRLTKQDHSIRTPRWSLSVGLALLHVPGWLAISGATFLVVSAMGGSAGFAQVAFATCMSWFLGFVVVGLPGGLGVREAAFIALVGSLDPGVAAAVALIARAVFVLVDLIGAGVASLGYRLAHQRKIET